MSTCGPFELRPINVAYVGLIYLHVANHVGLTRLLVRDAVRVGVENVDVTFDFE